MCFVAVATPPTVGVVALAAAVALAATTGRQGFDSLTQRLAPDAEKGRAFAGFEWRFELAWVVGAIIPVTFKPSLPIGLVAVGSFLLAAAASTGSACGSCGAASSSCPSAARTTTSTWPSSILSVARAATGPRRLPHGHLAGPRGGPGLPGPGRRTA